MSSIQERLRAEADWLENIRHRQDFPGTLAPTLREAASVIDAIRPRELAVEQALLHARAAVAEGAKAREAYEAVHAELERNGEDWEKINLADYGFRVTEYDDGSPLSYENWQAYMQQRLLNDYHSLVTRLSRAQSEQNSTGESNHD